jgi:hypothetical protein
MYRAVGRITRFRVMAEYVLVYDLINNIKMKKTILTKMVFLILPVLAFQCVQGQNNINWNGGNSQSIPAYTYPEFTGSLNLAAAMYNWSITTNNLTNLDPSNPDELPWKLTIDGQQQTISDDPNNQCIHTNRLSGRFFHSGSSNTFKIKLLPCHLIFGSDACDVATITLNFTPVLGGDGGSSVLTLTRKENLSQFDGARPLPVLDGCKPIKLTTDGLCPSGNLPPVFMTAQEITYDPITFDYSFIGQEVNRNLTASEVQLLANKNLTFTSFSNAAGTSTINFSGNKWFLIKLVNVRNGGWKEYYRYFQVKTGKHDYAMKNNAGSNASIFGTNPEYYEPSGKDDSDIFKSPDLWNNVPASLLFDPNEHDEPDFVTVIPPATTGSGNMMRFNLRNIGCNSAPPVTPHTLRLFWTRARTTELWDKHWIYSKAMVDDPRGSSFPKVVGGSEITIDPAMGPYSDVSQPIDLQDVPAGSDYLSIVGQSGTETEWFPPNPNLYNVTNGQMSTAGNRPVICFLAVINDKNNADDPLIWEPTTGVSALPEVPVYQFTKNNNNVVTRNSILMDNLQYLVDNGGGSWDHGFGTVLVNNDQPTARPITLCVDLDDIGLPTDFRAYGRIEVGVTNGLWNNWVSSGMNEENMTVITPTLFELTDVHGCIEDILVLPGSNEQIGLRFVYDGNATLPSIEENYEYVLSATYGESTRGTNSVFQARVPIQSPLNLQNKRSTFAEKMEQEDLELIVYPNPAKDQFLISVSLPLLSEYTITITDAFGKQIEVIEGTNATKYFSHKVEMKGNRAGVYHINLQSGDVVQQKRVVLVK